MAMKSREAVCFSLPKEKSGGGARGGGSKGTTSSYGSGLSATFCNLGNALTTAILSDSGVSQFVFKGAAGASPVEVGGVTSSPAIVATLTDAGSPAWTGTTWIGCVVRTSRTY